MFGVDLKEAIRIEVKVSVKYYSRYMFCFLHVEACSLPLLFFQKCNGLLQPEFKRLCVDPQITSFDTLRCLLIKAFNISRYSVT